MFFPFKEQIPQQIYVEDKVSPKCEGIEACVIRLEELRISELNLRRSTFYNCRHIYMKPLNA